MDFDSTIEIIIKDLSEAMDIIDDFKNYPGVPVLQVELAKLKCKSAEEAILLLKTFKPEDVPVMPEASTLTQEKEISVDETLIEISDEEFLPENEQESSAAKAAENQHEHQIFADKFSATQTTLLDQFASKTGNGTLHLIMGRSISSLTDAIGINDRFLFIREIFGGDSRTYDEVISRLDKATSFNDARAILLGYTGGDEGNEYIRQLLDIVKRKFPADG